MYLAENIKSLRKAKGWTQEEMAELIGMSSQSISKWERGDSYQDISLLPALSNLFDTSIDGLIGMDRINDDNAKAKIFEEGHGHLRAGDNESAEKVFRQALKNYPSDRGMMAEFRGEPKNADIDAYLKFIALGEENAQDKVLIEFGINMLTL